MRTNDVGDGGDDGDDNNEYNDNHNNKTTSSIEYKSNTLVVFINYRRVSNIFTAVWIFWFPYEQ